MKKLWKNNRVMFLLFTILLACFIAIVAVALTFFYSKNVSKYGSRLDAIDKHPIKSKFKQEYRDSLLANENVSKMSFNIEGRIIYINVTFKDEVAVADAKTLMEGTLEKFGEDILGYYDIEFVLSNANFKIVGAKNSIVDHVSWNNNKEIVKEEVNEES